MSFNDNLGLGVVRIKPLGAGGGGGERSAYNGQSIRYNANRKPSVAILDKVYNFSKNGDTAFRITRSFIQPIYAISYRRIFRWIQC